MPDSDTPPFSPDPTSSPGPLRADIERFLAFANEAWLSGDAARRQSAFAASSQMLERLKTATAADGLDAALVAAVWLVRGHLLETQPDPQQVLEALRCYENAIATLRRQPPGGPGAATGAAPPRLTAPLAGAWMNRANALLRFGTPEAFEEAIRNYDQALALWKNVPDDDPSMPRNAAGAAWMNRGNALLQLGGEERLPEALRSFDEALALLEPLAARGEPAACRNLASVCGNRGLVLMARGDAAGIADAIALHERAVATLRPLATADAPGIRIELAGALLNLGQARWASAQTPAALAELREVLQLVASREADDLRAADTGLRARHAACVIFAAQIAQSRPGGEERAALVAEAGDFADEGLALARTWAARGDWLQPAATRLYEFGAWLYRTQQPRFLAEFLLEFLGDNDEPRRRIAAHAVTAARQKLVQNGFAGMSGDALQDALDLLQSLHDVEERLAPPAPSGAGEVGNL
ncbi:hypothetical protein OpiT1DRAFT_03229 [Opitutaceae bacterium TAV1]|nr:hypothetical protein OpiT1DRAFT_03229 [Opitutaceae bacterium TAV1]